MASMEASDPMRLTKQLKGVTPIAAAINPATLGGAVLLTSACEDLEGDETNPDIIVPGGIYHFESRAMYHEQSLLGADLIEQVLREYRRSRLSTRDLHSNNEIMLH